MEIVRFTSTTARLANAWDLTDIGLKLAKDLENGHIYLVMAAGTGAQTMTNLTSGNEVQKDVSLFEVREIDASGDEGNIVANGGILAADTTPILRADAAESQEIFWATGNIDPVGFQRTLPTDFDGSRDVSLDFLVYSGTTDKFSITVESSFDGAAQVTDTADDTATLSATVHTITATIAAADIPDTAKRVSFALTPAAAHAANGYGLVGIRLRYWKK